MVILLKLGGSLITEKSSGKPIFNEKNVSKIASEISDYLSTKGHDLIIVHGAGSFGHPLVKETGLDKGLTEEKMKIIFAKAQIISNKLNTQVSETLLESRIRAYPIQLSSTAIMESGRLKTADLSVIKNLLSLKIVPILYGVPAYDTKQGASILSGDQIISYLCQHFPVKTVIYATDVNGIYTKDPHKYANTHKIPLISNKKQIDDLDIKQSASTDVTGGMFGKVQEILQTNVKTYILNGSKSGNISKALRGESVGTIIKFGD